MKIIRKFRLNKYVNPITKTTYYEIQYKTLFGNWKLATNKDGVPWKFVTIDSAISVLDFLNNL